MTREAERFPWVAAAFGALLVAAGGLSLLRLPAPPEPEGWVREAGTRLPLTLTDTSGERVAEALREELALQDPAPLFLPTRWNSGQAHAPVGERIEPGRAFRNFDPKLAFTEDDARIALPPLAQVPESGLEAVTRTARRPALRELGHQALDLEPLPPRLAFLRVSQAGAGQERLAETVLRLPEAATTLLQAEPWTPLELLVAIGPGGIIGRPAVILGSGVERVDTWAQDYLVDGARLGARLEPGFYRVVLGP